MSLSSRKSTAPYAVYGHFYDATQPKPDGSTYLHLLRRHHPHARTLLEIACGTGAHLVPLAAHYQVTGLDRSRTMLRYAREKLPRVKFHRQDMRTFKLAQTFDAIICPYDSINHLLTSADWLRTFKSAKRHLNDNGVFIFDINTEHRLRALAQTQAWTRKFGDNYLVMKVSMFSKVIADWDIRVFERVKPRTYRLHHEIIKERSFSNEHVRKLLRSCFDSVHVYDFARWSRAKSTSGRLYYVCR